MDRQPNLNTPPRTYMRVRIDDIRPCPWQPRQRFEERAIRELAESIRQNGLILPLTLRHAPDGGYELIAGERRLRALKLLGKRFADAQILDADEARCRATSLIENIQRENLHFFEEARAMRELLRVTGITQDALAKTLGKNPSTVANRLRLLKLAPEACDIIRRHKLTERHARALLKLNDPDAQTLLARDAAEKGLNVTKLETLIEKQLKAAAEPARAPRVKTIVRDKRMFINAVAGTVKKLTQSGVPAVYRVQETDDSVDVIVSLPKRTACAPRSE